MRLGPLCKGIKNAGPQSFFLFLGIPKSLPTFIEFFSNAIGLFHNDITGLQFVRTFSIVGKRVH